MSFPDPRHDDAASEPWSPSDHETVSAVLADWKENGIGASFRPGGESATLLCTVCESERPADQFEVVTQRRMEGASDPDDMVLLVAARCPVCHVSGAVVLGFGSEASDTDSDIVLALSDPPASQG